MSEKQSKAKPKNQENVSSTDAIVRLPFSEIKGKWCACGCLATVECSKGIEPGKWTEPKFCCDECWQNELPQIPDF